jgi:hypothetical protein
MFNKTVWGPQFWFFLHTIALKYPDYPNAIIKKKYYDLITNFAIFFPNQNYATFYNELLKRYPLSPYLDNKESLVKWTWFIHNKVNKKLEKPQLSLQKFYDDYKKQNAKNNKESTILGLKKIVGFIIVTVLLILICYFLRR